MKLKQKLAKDHVRYVLLWVGDSDYPRAEGIYLAGFEKAIELAAKLIADEIPGENWASDFACLGEEEVD